MNETTYLETLRRLWLDSRPQGLPAAPVYPFGEIPLSDYVRRWAERQPDKAALIFYGREVSYRELDESSDRFAALLASKGLRQGDRVALFMPNCPQFHIAFFGILKLGCVHVPVNPMFKAAELVYELNDTGATLIVALDQLYPLVAEVRAQTALKHVLVTAFSDFQPTTPTLPVPAGLFAPKAACPGTEDLLTALAAAPAKPPAVTIGLDDVAALNYTGGTTGMPKGCVHTQRDMIYTAATTCTYSVDLNERDIVANFYPVFWIAGEDLGLIFPLFAGATCVLLARWDAEALLAAIDRYRVTFVAMLVDNTVELMERPDVGHYNLRSLRATMVSSFVKKLNLDYRRRWHALTGSGLREAAWGMTETHTCDTYTFGMDAGDMDLSSQPVFVGLPVPGTEFKIVDFDTGDLRPLGQEGEIVMRSPSLLKAYWNKPDATRESLRDGWLHTGDIGLLDEHGYLHFLGRHKEMLKVKGMSVFPAEIEALLGQHPAVAGSGVVGLEDAEKGQIPVAFIRLNPEHRGRISEQELTEWCRRNMAIYKVPQIRFLDALPMTATGKVRKEELSKLLS